VKPGSPAPRRVLKFQLEAGGQASPVHRGRRATNREIGSSAPCTRVAASGMVGHRAGWRPAAHPAQPVTTRRLPCRVGCGSTAVEGPAGELLMARLKERSSCTDARRAAGRTGTAKHHAVAGSVTTIRCCCRLVYQRDCRLARRRGSAAKRWASRCCRDGAVAAIDLPCCCTRRRAWCGW
jgi:hypothetical protein